MSAQLDDVPLLSVLAALPPGFPAAVFPIRPHWHAQLDHDPQLSLPVWFNNAYELLFTPTTPTGSDSHAQSTRYFLRYILSPDSADTWSACLRAIATPTVALHPQSSEYLANVSSRAVLLHLTAGGTLNLSVQLVDSRWIIVIGTVHPSGTESNRTRSESDSSGTTLLLGNLDRSNDLTPTPVRFFSHCHLCLLLTPRLSLWTQHITSILVLHC